MSITAWYDVWCDDETCIDWTPGGPTRRHAAESAIASGWKRTRKGWLCPFHQKNPGVRATET